MEPRPFSAWPDFGSVFQVSPLPSSTLGSRMELLLASSVSLPWYCAKVLPLHQGCSYTGSPSVCLPDRIRVSGSLL